MGKPAILCLGLLLCACSLPAPDKSAEPIARSFYDEVHTGADLTADPHVAHELKNDTSTQQLAAFREMIPAEAPQSIETRAYDVVANSTGVTTHITDAYRYADRTLIAQTALFKSPSGRSPVIVGFNLSMEAGT
jgi:hypothetical protein